MPLPVRRGRCRDCGRRCPGVKRCELCKARQRTDAQRRRLDRKVAGLCVRCGVAAKDDESLHCAVHDEAERKSNTKRQRRRRRDPARRPQLLEVQRAERKRRAERYRQRGQCMWCEDDAEKGRLRCTACKVAHTEAKRLRELAARAGRKYGGRWDMLLADLERALPHHLAVPMQARELLVKLEDDVGSLGPTPGARERRFYRALADLSKERRVDKIDVAQLDGRAIGYRRPEPRITPARRGVAASDTSRVATVQHPST